jgi:hypothetical protein
MEDAGRIFKATRIRTPVPAKSQIDNEMKETPLADEFESADDRCAYVAESPIHGRGLFAARTIRNDEVIGWVRGVPATEDGPYVLWLSETEAIEVHCDLRFINHSDHPNARYYDDGSVVALRDILAGEEITHDYDGDEACPAEVTADAPPDPFRR